MPRKHGTKVLAFVGNVGQFGSAPPPCSAGETCNAEGGKPRVGGSRQLSPLRGPSCYTCYASYISLYISYLLGSYRGYRRGVTRVTNAGPRPSPDGKDPPPRELEVGSWIIVPCTNNHGCLVTDDGQ